MKEDLVEILQCPRCKGGKFYSNGLSKEDSIIEGLLICGTCDQEFEINKGMPNLIYNPPIEVVKDWERAAYGKKMFLDRKGLEEVPEDKRLFYAERRHFYDEPGGMEYVVATEASVNDIVPFIGLKKSERLLELGAGTCWSTARLAMEGCQCIATDISTDLKLELGGAFFEKYGIFFERVQACMQVLPFADGVFDVVFATTTLHHAPDLAVVFAEIKRVLKPGGRLYLVNEPIIGICDFTARKQFCKNDPIHHGEVEKAYNLWQWVRGLKKSGLNPRIYFPAYADIHLRTNPSKTFLGKIVRIIWRSKISKRVLLDWVLYPLLIFCNFGMCFAITARKDERIEPWCRFTTWEP